MTSRGAVVVFLFLFLFVVGFFNNNCRVAALPASRLLYTLWSDSSSIGVTLLDSSSNLLADSVWKRSAYEFSKISPDGSALLTGISGRLLTTSDAAAVDGSVRLCEWDAYTAATSGPNRCVTLETGGSNPRDMIYVPARGMVLIALPDSNRILAVNYADFTVSPRPWYSDAQDALFQRPSALEYDAANSLIYVALEDADSIWRFTDDGRQVYRDWAIVAKPRFLMLDRPSGSLYILTADLGMPELHRFRLSDGTSLSTATNHEGDWYPDELATTSTSSSNSTSSSSSGLLDALWSVDVDSIDGTLYAVYAYSSQVKSYNLITGEASVGTGAAFFGLPAQLNPSLIRPVALLRNEWQGTLPIVAIVDSFAWRNLATGSSTVFSQCVNGPASGSTLDLSNATAVMPSANQSRWVVVDTTEIYVLNIVSLTPQLKVCFDHTIWRQANGNTTAIVQAAIDPVDAAYVLVRFNTDATNIWNFTVASSQNNSNDDGAIVSLPTDDLSNEMLFVSASAGACTANLASRNYTCATKQGTLALLPAVNRRFLASVYDRTYDCIWVAYDDGSSYNLHLDANGTLETRTPAVSSNNFSVLSATLDPRTGITAWIARNAQNETVWLEWDSATAQFVQLTRLVTDPWTGGASSSSSFGLVSLAADAAVRFGASAVVNSSSPFTLEPLVSDCSGYSCWPWFSILLALVLGLFLCVWIVVISVACYRRHKRRKHFQQTFGDQELSHTATANGHFRIDDDDDADDANNASSSSQPPPSQKPKKPRTWWRRFLRFVRKKICCCFGCCRRKTRQHGSGGGGSSAYERIDENHQYTDSTVSSTVFMPTNAPVVASHTIDATVLSTSFSTPPDAGSVQQREPISSNSTTIPSLPLPPPPPPPSSSAYDTGAGVGAPTPAPAQAAVQVPAPASIPSTPLPVPLNDSYVSRSGAPMVNVSLDSKKNE